MKAHESSQMGTPVKILGIATVQANGKKREIPAYTSLKTVIPVDVVKCLSLEAGSTLVFYVDAAGCVFLKKNGGN